MEGYYASGMREWKDINTRLGLEHGDEFKFGYVMSNPINHVGLMSLGVEQLISELPEYWE